MLETIGVADHLPVPGCPIRTIQVADGLQPGGLAFEPDDDEPLGVMHENRHLRAALQARAEAGRNLWLLWKSTPKSVERGTHGVVVALEDGRKLCAPVLAAVDGRNSPTREAAGISDRPLEIRPYGGGLDASARAAARQHRLRDFLPDRARSRCCR